MFSRLSSERIGDKIGMVSHENATATVHPSAAIRLRGVDGTRTREHANDANDPQDFATQEPFAEPLNRLMAKIG
jgi:hypothetical protein